MSKELLKKAGKLEFKKMESKDTANVIIKMIEAKREYESTKEQEATKRLMIETNLKKYILKISNQREILESVLETEYALRKETIEQMFSYVDRALDEDKDEIVIAALNNIEGIVKESPLKEIASIAKAFENDDFELEI